jgi:hypothetical protein
VHTTIRHHFDIDADAWWRDVWFDPAFTEQLYTGGIGFEGFELVSLQGAYPGEVRRTLRMRPKLDAPATIKRLLGDSMSYTDEGRFDPAAKRFEFRVTPSVLAGKIRISGAITVLPAPGGGIDRTTELDFDVSIFGVGGTLEKFIAQQFEDNERRAIAFTERWIRSRPH